MKCHYLPLLLIALGCVSATMGSEVRAPDKPPSPTDVSTSVTQLLGYMATANATSKICLDWNHLADFFLDVIRKDIAKSRKQQISVPDIDREFAKKIGVLNVKGRLTATGGWFKDLSTLRRTGNVTLTVEGAQLFTIRSVVGLSDVHFGFARYEVAIRPLKLKGRIWGSVGSNSLELTVKMDAGDVTCKAVLMQVRVVELKDLKLMVTGFGILNGIVSKIANDSIQKSKSRIIEEIESILASEVRKELDHTQCSEYVGYLLRSAQVS